MNASHFHRKTILASLALAACVLVSDAADKTAASTVAALKVHPMVFSMVQGWLSDGESPMVTEINLDAVAASRNQFDQEAVKQEEEWTRCPGTNGAGFMRFRVVKSKGPLYTVEYQENGGGSLTIAATIECSVEKRIIRKDGKSATIRVLRVLSYQAK
jgi:hypothetical protein